MTWIIFIAAHVLVIGLIATVVAVHRHRHRVCCLDCGAALNSDSWAQSAQCRHCGRERMNPGLILPEFTHRDPWLKSLGVMLLLPILFVGGAATAVMLVVMRLCHWQ